VETSENGFLSRTIAHRLGNVTYKDRRGYYRCFAENTAYQDQLVVFSNPLFLKPYGEK